MRKTILLLFTLTLLFSLKIPGVLTETVEGTTTDDSEDEYDYDYDRIYKEYGLWYSVIKVENRRIFNVDSA